MNGNLRVFLDSDVIISSLLSKTGASYLLLKQTDLEFFISNFSQKELEIVTRRLNIGRDKLEAATRSKLKIINLGDNLGLIQLKYKSYTRDKDDCHIVAGSVASKAKFLITYNSRDYKIDKIKRDLNLICLTPGQYLQYLRSL